MLVAWYVVLGKLVTASYMAETVSLMVAYQEGDADVEGLEVVEGVASVCLSAGSSKSLR